MELNGIVQNIIFRNTDNGYTVLSILNESDNIPVTAVGKMPLLDIGDTVTLSGESTYNSRFGLQFVVNSYKRVAPSTETAIIAYLSSGAVKGIGKNLAKTIVSTFGLDTLNIMEHSPDDLLSIPGIGVKKLAMITQSFRENNLLRDILIALEPYGVTVNQAGKMMQAYGDLCLAKIQENPYQLIEDIDGIGFITADRIAQNVAGFETDSQARLKAGIRYTLSRAKDENGDTFLKKETLINQASKLLTSDKERLEEIIYKMVDQSELILDQFDDEEAIFLPYLAKMEEYIAKRFLSMRKNSTHEIYDISSVESELSIQLSGQQRDAVLSALNEGLMVITGGPGTGKTTIIRFIAHALSDHGNMVALTAPTGRAAKRMSEATGFDAKTIHRLLEYIPGQGFTRNQENPLTYDILIIDETSMVDVPLMYSLLKACPSETRMILVGDADQLPPVGCGNILNDVISSDQIMIYRLTEIFRQAQKSLIVRNAHLVNSGKSPILSSTDSDFIFEEVFNPEKVLNRVSDLIKNECTRLHADEPQMDIQVLVPMKSGPLGVISLNKHLQSILNPPSVLKSEHLYGETLFREGDKIMQMKNDYKVAWRKSEKGGDYSEGLGAFNGDLGTLVKIDKDARVITVVFDDGRIAEYEFTKLDELDLAYCITIHKSQGSEFKTIILPLLGGPPMLLTRNLLYTAITRAKSLVYCIGRSDTILRMVHNTRKGERNTSLCQRLIAYAEQNI